MERRLSDNTFPGFCIDCFQASRASVLVVEPEAAVRPRSGVVVHRVIIL